MRQIDYQFSSLLYLTDLVQDEATLGFRDRYLQGMFPPNHSVGAASEFTPSAVRNPPKQSSQALHPLTSFHTSFLHSGACGHYSEFQPLKIHSGIAHSLHDLTQSQALFPETLFTGPLVFSCTQAPSEPGEGLQSIASTRNICSQFLWLRT